MNDCDHLLKTTQVYLKPGEICFSQTPMKVTTVLGSCVSATLYHPPTGIAAICHAMQPRCPLPDLCSGECIVQYRYAWCAIHAMSRQMTGYGLRPRDIEAKLFGGAALMGGHRPENLATSMGRQNAEAAMEALHSCGLTLKVANVGGTLGRKIIFDTITGEVLMKRVKGISSVDFGLRRPAP